MRSLLCLAFLLLAAFRAPAQNDGDVIRSDKPITWLGLDFTKARFIGSANQFKDAGEVTYYAVRDKYIPAWNELFINEQKKYDVAKYVHRESVAFALDVTSRANQKVAESFFSMNPADFNRLTEADIRRIVKKYDFMKNKGTGLIFFVEGLSKGKDQAAAWVTFVDMGTRTVLQTRRITGKTGGIGFRNYWAKAFLNILQDTDGH
jgi:hypothetical protein